MKYLKKRAEKPDKGDMMELFNGRPEDTEGRLPREVRTYDLLDSLVLSH